MKIGKFLETWDGALAENRFSRIVILVLAIALVLSLIKAFTRDVVVIMQPSPLTEAIEMTEASASQTYKQSWALSMANLLGNVTPGNLKFVRQSVEPLLSAGIYQQVIGAMEEQAQQIRNDRVTMRFEPRSVEYEETTDTVFVYGYSYMQGATGDAEREDRTYEYTVEVEEWAPKFTYMNTYSGRPRTERVRGQMERKEERLKERTDG